MLKVLALIILMQVPAPTQVLAPATRYDASIPTLEQVAGHDFGAEITPPDQVIAYMQALAEAAPDRTELMWTGETWEGRPTIMLVIGSPERMARLDEIKADLRRLADHAPSTTTKPNAWSLSCRSSPRSCTAYTATRSAPAAPPWRRRTTCLRRRKTPPSI